MAVYVFWLNYDGSYITTCGNREQAEVEIAELLSRGYGTTVHGVVEGKRLVVHEREIVKVVKVKLKQEASVVTVPSELGMG